MLSFVAMDTDWLRWDGTVSSPPDFRERERERETVGARKRRNNKRGPESYLWTVMWSAYVRFLSMQFFQLWKRRDERGFFFFFLIVYFRIKEMK